MNNVGRWLLAVAGILIGCSVYLFAISNLPNKFHAAVLGGMAVIFTITEATIKSIIGHVEQAQKTKVFANRQYEFLTEKLALYRGMTHSFLVTNLLLKIVAGIAACLLLIENTSPFWPCLVGYGAMGWSTMWFIYAFAVYKKFADFRTKLDVLEREQEISKGCIANIHAATK